MSAPAVARLGSLPTRRNDRSASVTTRNTTATPSRKIDRWCRPESLTPWPKKAAFAADAIIAPTYMKVRSRPADDPIRAGSA
jgi:hypothetical protein